MVGGNRMGLVPATRIILLLIGIGLTIVGVSLFRTTNKSLLVPNIVSVGASFVFVIIGVVYIQIAFGGSP